MRTAVAVAHSSELGGSTECAFSVPFLPFDIVPWGSTTAGETGSVVLSDGHRVRERKEHVRHETGQIRPETGQ